jgi:anti-sigma regulatory factor (Ser/Thr protein kinase)
VVQRASGAIEWIELSGNVLGVFDDPALSDVTIALEPGDALVLYTDGVTERHAGTRFFDEEGLASVLTRCVGFTAAVVAERIELASRAFVEDAPRDDLAIVVLRVPEPVANTSATTTELPLDLTAPRLGRRFVCAALEALKSQVPDDVAALLVSELVTNSVVHATGPLRVSVEPIEDGGLRVTVTDGSDVVPQVRDPGPEAISGRGMVLVDRLARRWGVVLNASGNAVWFELGE